VLRLYRMQGATLFAVELLQRGPRDRLVYRCGLELEMRRVKYHCCYLIHEPSLQNLPGEARIFAMAIVREFRQPHTGLTRGHLGDLA